MKMAYADPPYLGCCRLYDHHHGADGRCWDDIETHAALIQRLCQNYPDGWAMSCSAPSLRHLWHLCPEDVRVAPWVKTFGAFKKGVRPAYMWEAVIFWRGRNPSAGHAHAPPPRNGKQTTPKDFLLESFSEAFAGSITLQKGLTGAKSAAFCTWILDLLNVQPGDTMDDLFPGTGIMGDILATRGRM